jgi:hypothetical protein
VSFGEGKSSIAPIVNRRGVWTPDRRPNVLIYFISEGSRFGAHSLSDRPG